jgi:excisionase family DNA binding protein
MEGKFYTIDQVAEMLGMHHKTIRKFITEGKLGASKVGKQWRISGHDLSIFIEKNNVNIKDKKINHEQDIDFSTNEEGETPIKEKINVSTVVDINEIGTEEFMRISNTLIAIANCKDPETGNSTITMKYFEKENRLRVMLWGRLKFTEVMLGSISLLVEQTNL